ncbi:hypothetical protein ASPU41_21170 (plasmid) [Arthrobacter sp. U41]|nr:hypothetical protein ASPU41_21170 [Arthrobacter sp. U41]
MTSSPIQTLVGRLATMDPGVTLATLLDALSCVPDPHKLLGLGTVLTTTTRAGRVGSTAVAEQWHIGGVSCKAFTC